MISELKNLIQKIYTEINNNNRKLLISKKPLSSKDTFQSLQNDMITERKLYSNGNIYEGGLKNGKRDRKGTMKYHNGYIYEGIGKMI